MLEVEDFFRLFNGYFSGLASKFWRWYRLGQSIDIIIFKIPEEHRSGLGPPAEVRIIKAEVKAGVHVNLSEILVSLKRS